MKLKSGWAGRSLRTFASFIIAVSAATAGAAADVSVGAHDPLAVATARPLARSPEVPNGSGAVLLTFEGLADLESVASYYAGGFGGDGAGPGPGYGITFSGNALALISQANGGTGRTSGEPTPVTSMIFLTGAAATMNVPAGFDTGFSFYYAAPGFAGEIRVYDGENATGNLLATLNLPVTPSYGGPDPNAPYGTWVPIGVTFPGAARSVDFGGSANYIAFDNITLGRATPIGGGDSPIATALPTISLGGMAVLTGLLILAAFLLRGRPGTRLEDI
jgi:hypothetical protein